MKNSVGVGGVQNRQSVFYRWMPFLVPIKSGIRQGADQLILRPSNSTTLTSDSEYPSSQDFQYVFSIPRLSFLSFSPYDCTRVIYRIAIDFALIEITGATGENEITVLIFSTRTNRLDVVYVEVGNEPLVKL